MLSAGTIISVAALAVASAALSVAVRAIRGVTKLVTQIERRREANRGKDKLQPWDFTPRENPSGREYSRRSTPARPTEGLPFIGDQESTGSIPKKR